MVLIKSTKSIDFDHRFEANVAGQGPWMVSRESIVLEWPRLVELLFAVVLVEFKDLN